ncbi:hypothetical protein DL96DRAFT_1634458 [Flagelloscypha sp. PMI_526]|nr:hypothetical protein DL96DRAFT_1634458 [Flagelloscypha sp. PMI_526]
MAVLVPDFKDADITFTPKWAHTFRTGCLDANGDILTRLLTCVERPSSGRAAIFPDDRLDSLLSTATEAVNGMAEQMQWYFNRMKEVKECRDRLVRLQGAIKELKSRPYVPISTLPLDTAQEIFRACVRCGSWQQARTFTLVSRQVQRWVDPIFFETIYYRRPHFSTREFLTYFNDSARLAPMRQSVRNLVVRYGVLLPTDPESGELIFQGFPSLQLISYDRVPSGRELQAWDFRLPSLRRFCWLLPHNGSRPVLLPFFSTLMHLQVSFESQSSLSTFDWDSVKQLTQLKVLAIDMSSNSFIHLATNPVSGIHELQSMILSARDAPSLQLIMWRSFSWESQNSVNWADCAAAMEDLRLVYCISRAYSKHPTLKEIYDEKWPFVVMHGDTSEIWGTQYESEAFAAKERRAILAIQPSGDDT